MLEVVSKPDGAMDAGQLVFGYTMVHQSLIDGIPFFAAADYPNIGTGAVDRKDAGRPAF